MSDVGVIHDIGYQRYEGPRFGRLYAFRSLFTHGLRSAYGLGRSGKAKVFPWIVVGILTMVAVILTVIRSQTGRAVTSYWEFIAPVTVLVVLFVAIVAPELVSRDIRGGVLPLYFSRPMTRSDYAFAKLAAIVTATFLLLAGPLTVMFLGGAFTLDGLDEVWNEFGRYTAGLAAAAVYALVFGSLALVVASLSGRRAISAAMTVGVFLITVPVFATLRGIAIARSGIGRGPDGGGDLTGSYLSLYQLSGLASPGPLSGGVASWWFGPPTTGEPDPVGPYGPLFFGVALALTVISVLLLQLRYWKVAR